MRADEFVHRIDAGSTATTTLYAVRRGEQAAGVAVHLASRALAGDSVLSVPDRVETGADGTATIPLTAANPGNPRGAVDGVVEAIGYSARLAADGSLEYAGSGLDAGLDVIVAHVRDAYEVPADPDWARDVQPILAQYSRLYPVMREHLVDLGDLDALRPWRAAMLLAMTRDIADPNHMPVTRDLSGPKRATIVRWLERLPSARSPVAGIGFRDAKAEAAAATGKRVLAEQALDGTGFDEE